MPLILIIFLTLAFIIAFWMGYQRILRLQHLNQRRLVYGLLTAMIVLTLMTVAHWMGYFPQDRAASFTMGLYISAAGFFLGFALKQYVLRRKAGTMEYTNRSFWTEAVPTLLSILLIAYGLYRMRLFTIGPFTGIGLTSGLSLVAFGLLGLTMRIVPEFRQKGILILDRMVPWQEVVAYSWHRENVIRIDYLSTSSDLTDFITAIPSEDELIIEQILGKKLKEHEEERKKILENLDQPES